MKISLLDGILFFSAMACVPDAGFAATPPAAAAPATPVAKEEVAPTDPVAPESNNLPAEVQKSVREAMQKFNHGDLDGAKADFQKALAGAPDNVPTLINLGLIAQRQKDYPEAERLLTAALHVQPELGAAWLVLGVIYFDQEKLDRALGALAQAAAINPNDARAHHYFGVTLGKKGWYLGAEDEMRKAIELKPDDAEAHFDLAVFYLQRTPPAVELARRHYLKARDLGATPDPQVEKSLGMTK